MEIVTGAEDLLIVSDDGTMIRTDVGSVSVYGRAAQGVRVMRLGDGSRVISVACTEKAAAEPEEAAEETEAEAPGTTETAE